MQGEGQLETDTQSFKEVYSTPSGKKGERGILSRKNDNRHPYDKRNGDIAMKLNLPELEKSDRETVRTMLNVTRMSRFYYLRNFHDHVQIRFIFLSER